MSNVINLLPEKAATGCQLLFSAAKLLRVSAAAFGEQDEPCGDADLADVKEAVDTAVKRVKEWLDKAQTTTNDLGSVYDALDVLTIVEALLAAELTPQNRVTMCPIAGSLRVAAESLEAFAP